MNRAERRRLEKQGKKVAKEPVINIKTADVDKIKKESAQEAVDVGFTLMLAIPTMVIHDKFGKLMKKVDKEGKTREETFVDLCLDVYDSFVKGYITLDDLHKCLYEEGGTQVKRMVKR